MKWVEIPKEHLIEDGQIRLARVRGHSMNLLYREISGLHFRRNVLMLERRYLRAGVKIIL